MNKHKKSWLIFGIIMVLLVGGILRLLNTKRLTGLVPVEIIWMYILIAQRMMVILNMY